MSVRVPIIAVLAIYARETGQGMIFAEDDADSPSQSSTGGTASAPGSPDDDPGPKPTSPADSRRARFKVVK